MNFSAKCFLIAIALIIPALSRASDHHSLKFPAKGIVCDQYFCADSGGISAALTRHYLGSKMGDYLDAQGSFDHSSFTFENGIYCDIKERLCYRERYFGRDGKPSSDIDTLMTKKLFP
ncbi:YcgJ family protein [Klebsiella aerogenes]|nr:hypothetical protein [Klebsiella aerogenes]